MNLSFRPGAALLVRQKVGIAYPCGLSRIGVAADCCEVKGLAGPTPRQRGARLTGLSGLRGW